MFIPRIIWNKKEPIFLKYMFFKEQTNSKQLLTGYDGKIWLVGLEDTNDATDRRPSTKCISEVPTNYMMPVPQSTTLLLYFSLQMQVLFQEATRH